MEKIKFLLAIHNHQPVGNFDHIFEFAFNKAYLPFLEILEKFPEIKVSLHYSGSLIDWLEKNKPEFIQRIENLVKKKQIEILSAGYYEPILALLPFEDRVEQIKLLNKKILSLWKIKPKGSWLTERIWEPDLPKTFKESDIEYTIVDDTHFEKVGKNREELEGYYFTEYENYLLKIFPGSKFLRYSIPFRLPQETMNYIRQVLEKGKKAITFADDGEKFGLWPGTYKWVYEEKWLEKFFQTVMENKNWVETITFSEYIEEFPPTERIYLTCASYDEMLEWSGGYFRNFLAKYPEANHMHKRMLEVSKKVKDPRFRIQNSKLEEAKHYFYMAQNNDSYWHGVFGGLYLNHLRYSVYTNLIKAEKIIEENEEEDLDYEVKDFDADGEEETILSNKLIKVYIDNKEKAGIYELDDREAELNLVNTIARRKERYHEKIKEKIFRTEQSSSQYGTSSIHDLDKDIPKEWKEFLIYDRYRRGCLLEYFLSSGISKEQFLKGYYEEKEVILNNYIIEQIDKQRDMLKMSFLKKVLLDENLFEVRKTIGIKNNKKIFFQYLVANKSTNYWQGKLGIEFNFSLWDDILSILGERENIDYLLVKDSWFNMNMEIRWDKKCTLWHFPVETIYETETGFEKNYQELCIFFIWNLLSEPKENWLLSGSLEIK